MKTKNIITLALLFAMSFSMVHEYVFTFYDDDHCSITEYVSEIDAPSNHGDICDIHFEYHIAYILPSNRICQTNISKNDSDFSFEELTLTFNTLKIYKPPIV